jgi:hypothetical protein
MYIDSPGQQLLAKRLHVGRVHDEAEVVHVLLAVGPWPGGTQIDYGPGRGADGDEAGLAATDLIEPQDLHAQHLAIEGRGPVKVRDIYDQMVQTQHLHLVTSARDPDTACCPPRTPATPILSYLPCTHHL